MCNHRGTDDKDGSLPWWLITKTQAYLHIYSKHVVFMVYVRITSYWKLSTKHEGQYWSIGIIHEGTHTHTKKKRIMNIGMYNDHILFISAHAKALITAQTIEIADWAWAFQK